MNKICYQDSTKATPVTFTCMMIIFITNENVLAYLVWNFEIVVRFTIVNGQNTDIVTRYNFGNYHCDVCYL